MARSTPRKGELLNASEFGLESALCCCISARSGHRKSELVVKRERFEAFGPVNGLYQRVYFSAESLGYAVAREVCVRSRRHLKQLFRERKAYGWLIWLSPANEEQTPSQVTRHTKE
ncbi:uncharacterized protein PADG_11795 [Paracoccidioides brasiliensis Pb18]|uniref:Uncharacterized protein n=2 Tax=Paracoccidioides brasiliensis TaxID=121759 RepID=A0A0A0HUH7_PARBD|nr:uncharacterized protein PADG_11795 [Paracoccidioides brasiliensis Pb18]KGM92008.1 hypothetical protein PADG_11795 [Paracoccidioides brasiliensis Pb18]ODH12883.1 hypothetical protein ACO22_07817 [Paracoccidioides brasiliensis]ODH47244.1 hypothetical protein GX48_06646 [Paracoccidioides brasiliensis]